MILKVAGILKQYLDILIRYRWKYRGCRIRSPLPFACRLGEGVIINRGCTITGGRSIGKHTLIDRFVRIDIFTESIGNYCSIAEGVKMGQYPHPLNLLSTSPVFYAPRRGFVKQSLFEEGSRGKVIIESDVWIGANAVILPGIKVATGAVIGAGAVVTHDVPPYAVVAGVPARVIKYRFSPDQIARLLASHWWDENPIEILNSELFNDFLDSPGM